MTMSGQRVTVTLAVNFIFGIVNTCPDCRNRYTVESWRVRTKGCGEEMGHLSFCRRIVNICKLSSVSLSQRLLIVCVSRFVLTKLISEA